MVRQPSIPSEQKNLAVNKHVSGLAQTKSKICDDKVRRTALSQINQSFYIHVAIIHFRLVTLRAKHLFQKSTQLPRMGGSK